MGDDQPCVTFPIHTSGTPRKPFERRLHLALEPQQLPHPAAVHPDKLEGHDEFGGHACSKSCRSCMFSAMSCWFICRSLVSLADHRNASSFSSAISRSWRYTSEKRPTNVCTRVHRERKLTSEAKHHAAQL